MAQFHAVHDVIYASWYGKRYSNLEGHNNQ